ncbi:MAG: hypothetical protein QME68_06285, partial [Elusimicrobiota bacterium]|nr:hypothetical protein [Elusimicrobiota bacterium]
MGLKRLLPKVFFIFNFVVFSSNYIFAESQKGTSTAIFLRMTPGARPSGMGNAFVGLSDDINALWFNPSGTTQLTEPQFFATYLQWIEGINNSYVGFVYPTGRQAFGLGVNYLSVGNNIELRDENEFLTGTGQVYNSSVLLSFARKIQK